MLPAIKGNKMINRALFVCFLMLGLSCHVMATNAADEEEVKRSNGYSAQGELLIPYDIVKRCNLGDGVALELTDECLYALACDKHQVFQEWVRTKKGEGKDVSIDENEYNGDYEISCMMAKYTKTDLDYIISRLVSGGNHENLAKEIAQYKTVKTLGANGEMENCSLLKSGCDESMLLGKEGADNNRACSEYYRCEEMLKQAQAVKDCAGEQGSTRCSIQINNALTADSSRLLSDMVHTKSMMNRNKIAKNIVNIIDKIEIDKEKCLDDIKALAEAGSKGNTKGDDK